MGRLEKMKRLIIEEANKRILGEQFTDEEVKKSEKGWVTKRTAKTHDGFEVSQKFRKGNSPKGKKILKSAATYIYDTIQSDNSSMEMIGDHIRDNYDSSFPQEWKDTDLYNTFLNYPDSFDDINNEGELKKGKIKIKKK